MSGGEQQMVAIGRALISKPDLLLLDEPSLGLAADMLLEATALTTQITGEVIPSNRPGSLDEAQMPLGGVKDSGYGRFGGKAGTNEFTELRWITVQDGPLHYPI